MYKGTYYSWLINTVHAARVTVGCVKVTDIEMAFIFMTVTLVAIVLQTRIVYADESIDKVKCKDQQATCEYDSTKKICHFRLQIEELQTFASYILKNNGAEEETRGVAGDTYYFTNTGFVPALSLSTQK